MRVVVVAAAAVALIGGMSPADANPSVRSSTIRGGWIGELPCIPTSATPNVGSPTTVGFTCASGTTWDGAWTGHTHYLITVTFDLISGDAQGTIDETFVGLDIATKSPGTLHLVGSVTAYGNTSTLLVRERITAGSGAFSGLTGTAVFEGTQLAGLVGHGGYHAEVARTG